MVPPAWRCLIRQAERPDQVAFAVACPEGPPSLGGVLGEVAPPLHRRFYVFASSSAFFSACVKASDS